MVTAEQKREAKISLLKEAIAQLKKDAERVQTDYGRSTMFWEIDEYEKELQATNLATIKERKA